MEQSKVFVSFFLDASRPNNDGKCLIKLNIYQKPNKQRYKTEFHLTKDEWEKLNTPKISDENLKEIKSKLNVLQTKAEKIIKEIIPFSFVAFLKKLFSMKSQQKHQLQTAVCLLIGLKLESKHLKKMIRLALPAPIKQQSIP